MWPLAFTAHRSGRACCLLAQTGAAAQRRECPSSAAASVALCPPRGLWGPGPDHGREHSTVFSFFYPLFLSRNLRYPALWEPAVGSPAAAGIIISRRSRLFFFDPFFCFVIPGCPLPSRFCVSFPCACSPRVRVRAWCGGGSPDDDDAVLAVSRGVAMTVSALPARRGHGWRGAGGGCTGILPTTTTRSSFGSSVCAQRSVVPRWLLA